MANPFLNIITDAFKQIHVDAITSLLASGSLSRPCRIIKKSKWVTCENCVINMSTGKSSNVYNGTGSISFTSGKCPFCNGEGRFSTRDTSTLYLMPLYDWKDWIGWNGTNAQTAAADGMIQTLSLYSTITDIKQAVEVVIDTDIEKYVQQLYQRESEPTPCGLGSASFLHTMWKKK